MKSIAKMLVLAAFAAATVHADDSPKSVALVRAMRTDEVAVANAKFAFLSGNLVERYGKTNKACVKRIPYTDFTAVWARVVESVLTPQEIDTSLAFYQSDAGVKYVEGLLRRMRARQGKDSALPEVPGTEDISAPQLAKISEFTSSDVGRKVMGKDLQQSAVSLASGREMTDQITRRCGGK
jgi:hypothetical protein